MKINKTDKASKPEKTTTDASAQSTPMYMSLYMSIGIAIGVGIGAATDNIPMFMSLGLCIGMGIGCLLDARVRAQAEKAKEQQDEQPGDDTESK